MADLSRDDVSRAVRDGLNDIRNDVVRIRESVQRVDDRTNDLDRSQEEIKRLVDLVPRLDNMTRNDKMDRIVSDLESVKATQASTAQYLQQIAKYLETIDQLLRQPSSSEKENWRK